MSYNLNRSAPEAPRALYADPREDVLPARPRRGLAAAAALLVMGVFAGGLWLAYVAGLRHSAGGGNGGDVPLIRADTRPVKVKPANPGGMAIPDRNLLIYDESRPAVEHLLPPPEQPMGRPAPPAASPPAPVNPPPPVPAARSLPASGEAPPAGAAAPAETAAIRAGMKTAATAAATAPQERPARREAAQPSAAAGSADPRPVPREASRAETSAATPDGVRLQLGSVRSAVSAREEWDRIRRSNPDLLGTVSAGAVRADLGDRGVYYRIETAPIGDAARASRLCGELRQRRLGCIVVR